jgi:tripartite-type tricarboxylate transporter receptor subunit TctC
MAQPLVTLNSPFCSIAAFATGAIFAAGGGAVLAAEVYPAKPIRLVHGYPGSSSEINARHIAQRLTDLYGQQVIV